MLLCCKPQGSRKSSDASLMSQRHNRHTTFVNRHTARHQESFASKHTRECGLMQRVLAEAVQRKSAGRLPETPPQLVSRYTPYNLTVCQPLSNVVIPRAGDTALVTAYLVYITAYRTCAEVSAFASSNEVASNHNPNPNPNPDIQTNSVRNPKSGIVTANKCFRCLRRRSHIYTT